ncbi:MAG: CpsD/CapB family tyrosine-protein kinase [Oscillospiraceae bacterium]
MLHLEVGKILRKKAEARKRAVLSASSPDYIKQSLLGKKSTFAANEAYKTARTNLMFTRVGDGSQTFVFTSSFSGEGKTVTCCNLALSMAQNGQKVLIIDADMRRPMVANMFDIPNQQGLSEFLAGLTTNVIGNGSHEMQLWQTQYPNLAVIPAGHVPPNPVELLASSRMKTLLDAAAKTFDYIFIDTPPVSVVTDAAVLVKNVQGYIMVVRAGVTPREQLSGTVLKLEQVGANILGFVLNDLDAKSGSYKYNGYHSYGRYGKQKRYGKDYGKYASRQPQRETGSYPMPVEVPVANPDEEATEGDTHDAN